MPEFKLTINDTKSGKSYKKIVSANEADAFKRTKLKSKVNGNEIGFSGYEFEITGGSDTAGFPMRYDIEGFGRKRPLITRGPGVRRLKKGEKARKTVVGNTLSHTISQINLKVIKYGSKSIPEILGIKEVPKEETKEVPKQDEVKTEEIAKN